MKTTRNILTVAMMMAAIGLAATSANAAIIVTPDHIVSGSATGTLIAIDVPFVPNGTTGGPTWTTGGGIVAHAADQGFTTVNDAIYDYRPNDRLWEPDGTPAAQAGSWFTYGNGPIPSVKWSFTPASGIAIPDGSTINGIYATWFTRNVDGITYQYTEGAASGSIVKQTGGAAPAANLVLSWTDDASVTRNGNFERIFSGPIAVTGGDGFELWGTDNLGNAAHIDAVVLDVTLPAGGPEGDIPEPATMALLGLAVCGLGGYVRRRRKA